MLSGTGAPIVVEAIARRLGHPGQRRRGDTHNNAAPNARRRITVPALAGTTIGWFRSSSSGMP